MRAVVEVVGKMYKRPSVSGGFGRLQPRYFQSQIGEGGLTLTLELLVRRRNLWENFPRDREAFPVDKVGRGSAYVWLHSRAYGEKGHGKTPVPLVWLVSA